METITNIMQGLTTDSSVVEDEGMSPEPLNSDEKLGGEDICASPKGKYNTDKFKNKRQKFSKEVEMKTLGQVACFQAETHVTGNS